MRTYVIDHVAKRTVQPELDRAVQASVDFGIVFTHLYGREVGAQFQYHLHNDTADAIAFLIALEIDSGAVEGVNAKWIADTNAFAKYLVATNPNFTLDDVSTLLSTNIDRERAMISARVAQQYDADAVDFNQVIDNLGLLANHLAAGFAVAKNL
jgi:hypothetical protein